jgi:hypothetical protein
VVCDALIVVDRLTRVGFQERCRQRVEFDVRVVRLPLESVEEKQPEFSRRRLLQLLKGRRSIEHR